MRLLTFHDGDALKLGLKTAAGIIDVEAALGTSMSPDDFFRNGSEMVEQLNAIEATEPTHLDEASLTLGPCVPHPGKVLCIGLNYSQHAAESGMDEPTSPVLFSKFSNTIAGHEEAVPFISDFTQVDYEAELVVVIGKTAKNVSEEEALDYVLGYCNGNDLSERALQLNLPGGQWLVGKTPDKFMPIGPYLVTADEAGDPQDMQIRGWMNGDLRQDSHTSDMIFSVRAVIAYASRFMTLQPGDIISTGTPEGVILGMEDKVWMQPGDEFTVEIGNLGRLSNTLVEA